jgi:dimethylaniline monooxygenase (N-oxide forming)
VASDVVGLYFAGFVDAPGGLLPVVEAQAEWIAAVLSGSLLLPPREQMRKAIERVERRTRQRFPEESPRSVRCDPHAYRRLLLSDLRGVRRRVWHVETAPSPGEVPIPRPRHAQRA